MRPKSIWRIIMAEKVRRDPHRPPIHPGEVLREDVIPALKMTVVEIAGQLRVSRQTLHRILAEKASITPEMAVRIGKFCGNGPGLWLRMQEAYDLWHAQRALAKEIKSIPTIRTAA